MKLKLFFLLSVLLSEGLFGDLISEIKQIENKPIILLKFPNYNFFEMPKIKVKAKKAIKPHFKVLAIFDNSVFINGKWYKVGDVVYGFRIVKIYDNRIVVKRDGKFYVVRLKVE